MGVTEEAGKVATSAIEVMKGAPVILALLLVNGAFLMFFTYLMGSVAENSRERNKDQISLISTLIKDVRECRQGISPQKSILYKRSN